MFNRNTEIIENCMLPLLSYTMRHTFTYLIDKKAEIIYYLVLYRKKKLPTFNLEACSPHYYSYFPETQFCGPQITLLSL